MRRAPIRLSGTPSGERRLASRRDKCHLRSVRPPQAPSCRPRSNPNQSPCLTCVIAGSFHTSQHRPRKRPGSDAPEVVPTQPSLDSITSPSLTTARGRYQTHPPSKAARYPLTRGGAYRYHPHVATSTRCATPFRRVVYLPYFHHGLLSAPDRCPIRERPGSHSPEVVQYQALFDSTTSPSFTTVPGRYQIGARFDHPSVSPHGLWLTPGRCSIRGRPGTHSPEVTQHGPRDARCAGASMRRCEGRDCPRLAHDTPSRWSIWEWASACSHA